MIEELANEGGKLALNVRLMVGPLETFFIVMMILIFLWLINVTSYLGRLNQSFRRIETLLKKWDEERFGASEK